MAQETYSTGSNSYAVVAADLNGDSELDIVVANCGSQSVGVFLSITDTGRRLVIFVSDSANVSRIHQIDFT